MRLRVLGCSGGIGVGLRTTCLQVDRDILIDAGTGLGDLTLSEMAEISHIFLTHSHLDHITGIPLMVDSVFEHLLNNPIVIHAREETIKALQDYIFNWAIWPDFSMLPNAEQPVLKFEVMQPGTHLEVNGRKFETIEVHHAVPAVGYRVKSASGTFVFSGDTTTNDNLWVTLNQREQPDLMIVECAFPDRELDLSRKAYHYCPSLLADDLGKFNHRPPLYITHLKPGAEDEIMAECEKRITDFKISRLSGGDILSL